MHVAIPKFKILTKYLKDNFLSKIEHPQIQQSTNMSIIIKPQYFMPMNFNDFTVLAVSAKKCNLV